MEYNVYCDESCHLEHDKESIMVLGAVWCPREKIGEITSRLREIKIKNGFRKEFEVKWSKVSPSKTSAYLNFLDYFFDDDDLHFRGLIAPKANLSHDTFKQSHDEWYYKMYFNLLKVLLSPKDKYRVFLDIKDSHGGAKVAHLHDILCSNMYDFSRTIIDRIQIMRSDESEIMQLADLLIGIISYHNRGFSNNQGKVALVNRMKERSHYSLTKTTLYREDKVNLFKWSPSEAQE